MRVQVLIAGGGPVGLAAAVELGLRGITTMVVEPRTTVSHARPRCKTVSIRSMEHLRRWGLADRLRERAPLPVAWSQDVVFCTSLAGHELSRFTGVLGLAPDGDRFPEVGQQAPQYVLEEVLREAVADIPACTPVTGSKVKDIVQDEFTVRTTVSHPDGTETVVESDYVIGADGPRSTVREQIGADYQGGQALRPNFGMVFDAPELREHVKHGPAVQYWIINGDAPALMGPIDRTQTWWLIAFGVERENGERNARAIIDAAAGVPVEATVLSTDPWTARMQIVDRMRVGRVFLAGDAAHLNPPFGGHGLNTGLGDAVDLGWKLAAVLGGWAGPALLDSYETERRPVQERVIREATANMAVLSTELLADNLEAADAAGEAARSVAHERIQETKKAEFHALDLVLGIELASDVIAEGGGARLDHFWLGDGRSLYDALGPGFTLLVLDSDDDGEDLMQAAAVRGVPVNRVFLPGKGDGLVLVRPDQHVAWRGDHPPADLLDRVLPQPSAAA